MYGARFESYVTCRLFTEGSIQRKGQLNPVFHSTGEQLVLVIEDLFRAEILSSTFSKATERGLKRIYAAVGWINDVCQICLVSSIQIIFISSFKSWFGSKLDFFSALSIVACHSGSDSVQCFLYTLRVEYHMFKNDLNACRSSTRTRQLLSWRMRFMLS